MKKNVGIYVLKAIGYAFLAGVSIIGFMTSATYSLGNCAAAAGSIVEDKKSEESDQ